MRVEDGAVTIRPLAGTRRRGADEDEDRAAGGGAAGRSQGAGRAHHARRPGPQRRRPGGRIRLGPADRRDEGRALFARDAHHLERHRPAAAGESAFDALRRPSRRHGFRRAKVRAMQIIDEVEAHKRGPYAGAVGYIDFTGNMDTCIALRTMVIQGKTAYIQAGGGVVYDSVPAASTKRPSTRRAGSEGDRDRRIPARRMSPMHRSRGAASHRGGRGPSEPGP